ncbi:hypothetical protein UFOVP708_49 [uncultured Caudovirales phage]|uniref:Uncharacterized protein n=1 Tax=uncultured Caudovirales phage TaxID=2100421 RepID=A0A6J5NNX2_9CAUD|nr:hypothetical protein UFOVP708_49 [uncultured Caudovirales phage]
MKQKPTPISIDVDSPTELEALLKEYALAEAMLDQAKEAFAPLRKQVLALVKPEPSCLFAADAGDWQVTIEFPDKVVWDDDQLAAYYGGDLPVYVKRKLAINETDWARLGQQERDALTKARDVVAGTPKITVEKV